MLPLFSIYLYRQSDERLIDKISQSCACRIRAYIASEASLVHEGVVVVNGRLL